MAQTFTLDEAADVLGMTPEEMKRRLREDAEFKALRSFRDGSTLRFRSTDIEELARKISSGSDLNFDAAGGTQAAPAYSDELTLNFDEPTVSPATSSPAPSDELLIFGDSDDFSLTPDEPVVRQPKSAVPLSPGTDSDIKLDKPKKAKKDDDEESIFGNDDIQLDLPASHSGRHSSPSMSGRSKVTRPTPPPPPVMENSDFELKLESDASDFDLKVDSDSDADIGLGEMPAGNVGAKSGINLHRPSDSGPSLEKPKKAPEPEDDDIDFELSLDNPAASSLSGRNKGPKSGKIFADDDSSESSEFELTLDDDSSSGVSYDGETSGYVAAEDDFEAAAQGDIFDTDFEIPALDEDSASEVVSMDDDTGVESSEFDLQMDDSSSEFTLEEEGSDLEVVEDAEYDDTEEEVKPRKKPKKRRVVDEDAGVDFDEMDLEEGSSASSAMRGLEPEDYDDEGEVEEYETVATAAPAPWGAFPVIFMIPALFVSFVALLGAYEMVHTMWGFQTNQSTSTVVIGNLTSMLGL